MIMMVLLSVLNSAKQVPLPAQSVVYPLLRDLRRDVRVTNDTWNGIPNSEYEYRYFDGDREVASTTFRAGVGQIGWISTVYEDRGNPVREAILFEIMDKMLEEKIPPKTIWESIVSEQDPLYKKWGFRWKNPAHHTVTGAGWMCDMDILKGNRYFETDVKGKIYIKGRGSWDY